MIGVLDWGIGGVGFVKLLRERVPGARVIYFSDTGFTPYGKVPAARLAARVREMAGELRQRGVRHLVIACNAASTVLPRLGVARTAGIIATRHGPITATGIIDHAVRLVLATSARRVRTVGVVGGHRTIRSGIYRRAIAAPTRGTARIVVQRVAQPLSALVEAGELASRRVGRALDDILGPIAGVDALLLACTHYAALADRFAERLPRAKLLDPAPALADWVAGHWAEAARESPASSAESPLSSARPPAFAAPAASGRDLFLTSGNAHAMRRAALRAFGVRISPR